MRETLSCGSLPSWYPSARGEVKRWQADTSDLAGDGRVHFLIWAIWEYGFRRGMVFVLCPEQGK